MQKRGLRGNYGFKVCDFHLGAIRYLIKERRNTTDPGFRRQSLHVIGGVNWRETRLRLDYLGAIIMIYKTLQEKISTEFSN